MDQADAWAKTTQLNQPYTNQTTKQPNNQLNIQPDNQPYVCVCLSTCFTLVI